MIHIRQMVLVLLALGCSVALGEDKESFYDQLNRAVIRLEHVEVIQKEQEPPQLQLNTGTAFFVRSGNELYVVSARHVVEQEYDLRSRVQSKNRKTGEREVVSLELPRKGWIYHPHDEDEDTHYVDVAAMKVPWNKDCAIMYFRYEPEDPNKNQLPSEDAQPPEPILVFGFPGDLGFTLLEQRPMGRSGIISMSVGREFLQLNIDGSTKLAEERCCLIDARMFRGNSGSPVMSPRRLGESKPNLLGLLTATNATLEFGVIEPVSRIRETLDVAKRSPACAGWKSIPKKAKPVAEANALD